MSSWGGKRKGAGRPATGGIRIWCLVKKSTADGIDLLAEKEVRSTGSVVDTLFESFQKKSIDTLPKKK